MKTARLAFLLATLLSLAAPAQAGEIVVSAAASLTSVFQALKTDFERSHPDTTVATNFGAQGFLVAQIERGAPSDVLVTADMATMDKAATMGLVVAETRKVFAGNRLLLLTRANAPSTPASLADLDNPSLQRIGLGNVETTAIGIYVKKVLMAEGLWERLQPKFIFGETVKQISAYLAQGDVEAAFLFVSEAILLGDKVIPAFILAGPEVFRYPAAVVAHSAHKKEAQAFIEFLGSERARRIIAASGHIPLP